MSVSFDNKRVEKNAMRLKKLHPAMADQVAKVLANMERRGWEPLIDVNVHRSRAEQAEMVRRGVSKVHYSFHNVTEKDGTPASLAVDITDARWGWESPRKFWLQLGWEYLNAGLDWGGFFGLKKRESELREALRINDWIASRVALGWDVAHGQWRGISLTAAKLGKRPNPRS